MKLDHTAYACLDRCPQEYVYRHQRHLTGAEPGAAAHFGQMLHLGVQALWNGESINEACAIVVAAWNIGFEQRLVADAMRAEKREILLEPGGCLLIEQSKFYYSPQRVRGILSHYHEAYFAKPLFDLVWNEGYAESDTECAIPDRAVRSKLDGLLYAMDLKTTGLYISPSWQAHFAHNQQVAIQLDVLEATLGERIAGFWLDAVHVARTTPSQSDLVRAGPFLYSEALRAELREQREKKRVEAQVLELYPSRAQKHTESCVRYTQLCPYFDLCKADPADREPLIQIKLAKGQLKESAWEPQLR